MTFSQFSNQTKILIGISALLILGIPFANLYAPFIDIANLPDVWLVDYSQDPHILYRFAIIIMGIGATIIGALALLASFFKKQRFADFALNLSLFLLIFAIGFKNYPYWANGLFFETRGLLTGSYDPKAILPMVITGELWRMPILFFHLLFLILPFFIVAEIILIAKLRQFENKSILRLLSACLTFVSFWATPEFLGWLMD